MQRLARQSDTCARTADTMSEENFGFSIRVKPWQNPFIMKQLHHDKGMAQVAMADKLGCTPQTIRRWLRKHNIEITSNTPHVAGEDHPRHRSDRPPEYGSDWVKIAETVRERDGYECQRCGRTQEESLERYGRKLDVHHTIPRVTLIECGADFDAPDFLITLCSRCHTKVE